MDRRFGWITRRIANAVNYNTSIVPGLPSYPGGLTQKNDPRRMMPTTELGEVLVRHELPFDTCCAAVIAF